MLSRLRRAPAAPPAIHEPPAPPPPAAARREKESRWLASIGLKGGRGAGRDRDRERDKEKEGGSAAAPSVRSAKSARSFRFGLGGGGGRARSGRKGAVAHGVTLSASRATLALPSNAGGDARERAGTALMETGRRASSSAPPLSAPHASSSALESAQPQPRQRDATVSLAQRLQELAIANADGLLDEDEYRILRGQLFVSGAGAADGAEEEEVARLAKGTLAVPSLKQIEREGRRAPSNIVPSSPPEMHLSPSDAARLVPPTSTPHLLPSAASQRAPSLASTARSKRASGLAGLFRRPSAASAHSGVEPLSEGWTHVSSPALSASTSSPPLDDGASTFSRRSSRRTTNYTEPPTQSPPLAGGYTTHRTRSIRHHAGLGSSAFSPRLGSARASSPELEIVSTSGRLAATTMTRTAPASRSAHRSGAHSHASRSSVSHSSAALYPLPAVPSSSDPAVLAAAGREPGAAELRGEIGEIEEEWRRMRGAWEEAVEREVRGWEDEVGEEVVSGLWSFTGGEAGGKPPRHGRADELHVAVPSWSIPAPTTHDMATLPPFLARAPPAPVPPGLPDDIDLSARALQRRVRELQARQDATEEKYQRRVDFLRAKLRAAEIKERLR
ncbi:hypothetical protein JCM10449v2_007609 [Rhodotorula kratochvilovae]